MLIMIQGKRVLALIPARGGSKGIKNKNIRTLNGKPLIAYTIEAAGSSRYVDTVLVTTDSEEIAGVAKEYGAYVPFLRPAELASDTAKTIDAVLHAVEWLRQGGDGGTEQQEQYDILVLLQPTSPLRTTQDIDKALELFARKDETSLASVSPVEDHPVLIRTIDSDGTVRNLLAGSSTVRRQDMPDYYRVNGSIYINRIEELSEDTSFNDNPLAYVMRSDHSIDIDEEKDLILAEWIMKRQMSSGSDDKDPSN